MGVLELQAGYQRETKQFPSFPRVERPSANPGSRRGLSCMRALRSLVLALSAGYTARAEPEPEVRRERPLAARCLALRGVGVQRRLVVVAERAHLRLGELGAVRDPPQSSMQKL